MDLKKSRILNVIFWVWFITVIILSVVPRTPRSQVRLWGLDFRLDYLEHLVVYFILGLLYVSRKRQVASERNIIKVLYILMWMIFAIATEIIQKFVAGRSFNPNDMYYNVMGIILGLVTTMVYFYKIRRRVEHENLASN